MFSTPCWDILSAYYMWRRELNRQQFINVNDANIFNQYDLVKKNINEIDDHQELMMHSLLNGDNPCDFLKDIIFSSSNLINDIKS